MGEKKVVYHQCVEGDVLSRHIINIGNGVVLCKKGRTLTRETVEWLQNFNHTDIYVEDNEWNKVWHLEEEHIKVYEENALVLKETLENFRFTEDIDYKSIGEVCNNFFEHFDNDNSAIMGCVNRIKEVDAYTYTHSLNVGMLAVAVGKWMQLPQAELHELMLAGILHDIGKYRVPEKILNKKGSLSEEEYLVMKKHVNYGYDLIRKNKNIADNVKMGMFCHHERNNGNGYPRQLVGEEIHLYGKILAVVDVYDAMISERIYKNKQTPFEVMGYMITEELGRLDPEVLLTFLSNMANYYVGVEVKLSTGDNAKVVFIPSQCIYRPIVKVQEAYIDLSRRTDIQIVDII